MSVELLPWDPVDHLRSDEQVAAYLEAAMEDGEPRLIAAVIGDVARARGLPEVAGAAGVELGRLETWVREEDADLAFGLRILAALGYRLTVAPAAKAA